MLGRPETALGLCFYLGVWGRSPHALLSKVSLSPADTLPMDTPRDIYDRCYEEAATDFTGRLERLFERFYEDDGLYLAFHNKKLSVESRALLALIGARYELTHQIFRDTLLALKREGFL